MPTERWYPFERLDVYHLAVKYRRIVSRIVSLPNVDREDIDQASRSSKSGIRNICEAAGEFRPNEQARFFRMSLRSITETAGTMRIIEEDIGPHPDFDEVHDVGYELVAKLTSLSKKRRLG